MLHLTWSQTPLNVCFLNRADYLGFHSSYGRTIMKQFRSPAPSEADIEKGFPIAFSEFVDYVISFSVRITHLGEGGGVQPHE